MKSSYGELQLAFTIEMLAFLSMMKMISILLTPKQERVGLVRFFITPLPCFQTWKRCPDTSPVFLQKILLDALVKSVLAGASFWAYFKIAPALKDHHWLLGYAAVLPALMVGVLIGPWLQLLYSPLGRIIPLHHCAPFLAISVSDFWRARWNIWVSDWFRQAIFNPLRKRPVLASFAVFTYSGIWHELVLNLPTQVILGVHLIGSMLLYFLIQWLGMMLERKLPRRSLFQRIVSWAFIVGPAPLMINVSLLRTFMVWPN